MNDPIADFLGRRIEEGDFPSAVFLVGERDKIIASGAIGKAVVEPETIDASLDTIYDLASLTKPLVTGLLTAMLIEKGTISLDHKVSAHLPEFDTDGKRMITIGDLVAHTSRLPSWVPFYLLTDEPENIIVEISALDLDFTSGDVIYGDPNFIVLGVLLERLGGTTLDKLAYDEIFAPLGLRSTSYNPPPLQKIRTAANELGNGYELQMCIENGYSINSYSFRNEWVWGEVHDGNAYFMSGVAGHAGLFSNVGETFLLAQQFLPTTTSLLKPGICRFFVDGLTPRANESRSLAFQLASTPASTAGPSLSPQSFGHLGFTGTSLWVDPVTERFYILLTNRTHRRDLPFSNINSVRRRFHELAAAISS